MTNRDRIFQLDDGQLARFIVIDLPKYGLCFNNSAGGIEEWLGLEYDPKHWIWKNYD